MYMYTECIMYRACSVDNLSISGVDIYMYVYMYDSVVNVVPEQVQT